MFVVEHVREHCTVLEQMSNVKNQAWRTPDYIFNSETWSVSLQINALWNYFLKYVWEVCFSSYSLKFNVRSSTSACPAICWCRDIRKPKAGWTCSFLSCRFPASGMEIPAGTTELVSFILLKLLIYRSWKGVCLRISVFLCFVTSLLPILK